MAAIQPNVEIVKCVPLILQEANHVPTPVAFEYKADPTAVAFTAITTYDGTVGSIVGDCLNNPDVADFGAGDVPVAYIQLYDSTLVPFNLLVSVVKFTGGKIFDCAAQTYS